MNTALDHLLGPWPWIARTSPAMTAGAAPKGRSFRALARGPSARLAHRLFWERGANLLFFED
jgi:hypothetical protein